MFKSYVKSTWVKLYVKSAMVRVEIMQKAFSYVKSTLVCVKACVKIILVCVQVLCKKHLRQVVCKKLKGSSRKYIQKAFSYVKSALVCVKKIGRASCRERV